MTDGARPHPAFAILVVTSVSAFVVPFMGAAMNIALPSIAAEFAFGAVTLTWVTMAYLLASAMLLLPFGRMADIYGRRRCFLVGTAAFTLFSGLAALATTGGWLIAGRVLQGIGGAMAFPTSIAILTEAFPREQRGKALGINVTSVYLGLSLGPVIGGLLVNAWGWRSILWVNVPLGLVILALAVAYLPPDTPHSESRVDIVGSGLFSLALGLLVYGFSRAATGLGQALIGLALLGFAAFGRWELRAKHPMLDVRVFASNRLFLCSNLAALINYASTSAVGFLLSLYLQNVKGLTPAAAGVVLLVQPAIMTHARRGGRGPARATGDHDAALIVHRRVVRPGGAALSGERRHGGDGGGAAADGLDRRRNAPGVDRGRPRVARLGLRVLLVAQHQRGDGLGGAAASRRGLGHTRDDAADGTGVEHGPGGARAVARDGRGEDRAGDRSAPVAEHPAHCGDFCGPVRGGRIRLVEP
jgi:MFS family permease